MFGVFMLTIITFFSNYNARVMDIMKKETFISANSKFTWTNVGPEGGYFRKVIVSPQDSNLAILQGILIWITRDGTNWEILRDGGMDSYITFTGYHRLLLGIRDTLYYSSDGANTFSPIRTGHIRAMSLIPSDTVYLIQDSMGVSYLYRTTDGGINWDRITPLSYAEYRFITFAPSDPNVIYMAVNIDYSSDSVNIVRSVDGGVTWSILSSIGNGVDVTDIEVNPQNPGEAFISCGFEGGFGLVYTQDSFQTLNSIPNIIIPYDVEFISSDSILVASVIPTGIMLGTRDSNGDWIFEPVDTLTTCTGIARSGNVFYVSAMTGVLKSTDGGLTFQPDESGLHGTFTYSGKSISNMIGRTVYLPSVQGNALYITRNGGVTWEKVYIPDVAIIFDVEANPQDENIVYLACGAGRVDTSGNFVLYNIMRSLDGGMTFTPMDSFIGDPDSIGWIESIHTFSDSPNVILGMSMVYSDDMDTLKIVRSTNGGSSFDDTVGVFTYFYDNFAGDNPVFIEANSVIFVSYDYGITFDTLITVPEMVQNMVYYDNDSTLFFNNYLVTDSIYKLKVTDLSQEVYYLPGLYDFYAARNGGFYSLANSAGFLFYAGTYEFPFDTFESLDIPIGAIRASSNEVLLFSYGMGVFRSQDAVSSTKERRVYSDVFNHGDIILASEVLRIPYSLNIKKAVIFTPEGRVVKSVKLESIKHISLRGLNNGVYMVRLYNGKNSVLLRVLKIR